jgi:cytochrome c oxidase cbb3-type subunit III
MVLLLAALTIGCEPPGKPNPADRPRLPDQVVSFDQLFATNCVGCHGVNGERGPAPPLNNPLFVAIVPEDDLLNVIRHGRSDTPMPPFAQEWGGTLTDKQIKILAEGIRTKWKSDKSAAESLPPYAAIHNLNLLGATDDVKRGEELFARACATCHGDQGKGVKSTGKIENAINVPAFLALISDQAVRRTIICGRQDLGMPTFADGKGRPNDFKPLTSDEIDALVALIAHWRAAGSNIAQTDQ